jgi:predicted TIM-barrel fold metal-dependent hydrolase
MQPIMKDGHRFVDCDMHIMEPPDLFERYIDRQFASRITMPPSLTSSYVRPKWLIDGIPTSREGFVTQYNRVSEASSRAHSEHILTFAIKRKYDQPAQLAGMAMEGVDIAVLFPTVCLGILGRNDLDPPLSHAICRAYNDWLGEFCSYSPDQLKMAAMLPIHDVNLACQEIVRCVERYGAVAAFLRPNYAIEHFWHSTHWDPLYRTLAHLDVPLCFHEGLGSHYSEIEPRFGDNRFMRHVASHSTEMQLAAIAIVLGGIFEAHPALKVAFLEAQSWWVPGLLGRMAWDLEHHRADAPLLTQGPFDYWRQHCFSTVEGSEREIGAVVELLDSAENICISTDYPHFDSNFPHVSSTILGNPSITPDIGAQILFGGARLYGFSDADFQKADAAAAAHQDEVAEIVDAIAAGV